MRRFLPRMAILRKLLADRRVRIFIVCLAVATACGVWLAWKMGVTPADLKDAWRAAEIYLRANPWALFGALVVLPGLPIPTSALMLLAGVVWRDRPLMACLICLLALALNLSWTYWLAAGPARRLVEKFLKATGTRIPDLPRGHHIRLILVLKLTPGIPLFLQNYLLGFLRAPFLPYLGISILGNGLISVGIVLGGAGLADGRLMPALTGVSLIAVGVVLTHFIREWLGRVKAEKLKVES